jgi:hypothetical protein
MDYDGGDLIEGIHSHGWAEEERCEQQGRRIWLMPKLETPTLIGERQKVGVGTRRTRHSAGAQNYCYRRGPGGLTPTIDALRLQD